MTLQFPTTTEAFTAVQAQLVGRPIGAKAQEAVRAWVPIFNDCFQAGLRGDRAELDTLVGRLDTLVGRLDELDPRNKDVVRFLKAAREWMIYAWEQGHERSKTA